MVLLLIVGLRYQASNSIYDGRRLYETSLSNLRNWHIKGDISRFRGWELLPYTHGNLTNAERLKIVKYYDDPPGVDGRPVLLQSNLRYDIKQKVRIGWKLYHFNSFVSDLIPVNRSLPDWRDKWCRNQNYSSDLPSATVIICFYNEAWSALIRTITSVLNRTPPHLLDNIILVDDASTFNHLHKQLDDYVNSTSKVILKRSSHRIGIARARMLPVQEVQSPVLVYLDSHCECSEGWLEPLLQRIKENPSTVVSPSVDNIHDNTFQYIPQEVNNLQMGGFTWDLKFAWIGIPQTILESREEPLAPITTATISGGLLAVSKDFFVKQGMYDTGMNIWGAENLELSFKTWMCGGSMEIVPCSHVGHVFKMKSPYKDDDKILKKNFVRLAKVWLDDYAKYFYERIGNDIGEYGNITERIKLRKKLNCHSFQWYLENVTPHQVIPDTYVASGPISSILKEDLCLDAPVPFPKFDAIDLYPCHGKGGNQYWSYTSIGELRRDDLCIDYLYDSMTLFFCNHAASQLWLYFEQDQIIVHNLTLKCLNIAQHYDGYKPLLTRCNRTTAQKWKITNFRIENFTPELQATMKLYKNLYEQHNNKLKKNRTLGHGMNLTITTSKINTLSFDMKREGFDNTMVGSKRIVHAQ
ncbi:unnamed protein product [Arctia plantaginis]|uniref:Polypeptide N-acetylgalactosaminyltransferase n=1 Tax=Arctia plantaginis TaxID=874455 RepID=A0A8S1BF05_ARCPL|nr:unnamed protein product [Arctia plantaginis]